MPVLSDIVDIKKLIEHIETGNINARHHETLPLSILKYSKVAPIRFSPGMWDDTLSRCRGLVIEQNANFGESFVVARPIEKFHNYGSVRVPNIVLTKQPVVTDKLDGSCILAYKYNGSIVCSTLGSFHSEQADWANKMWQESYSDITIPDDVTAVFEGIYLGNRIVVHYDYDDLVLITAIDNNTGADIPLYDCHWWTGRQVETHYDVKSLDEAYYLASSEVYNDAEGVVITWYRYNEPSFRLKAKNSEYVRMHGIITKTNSKTVWEALQNGRLEEILTNVPDELHAWVQQIAAELNRQYNNILFDATLTFGKLRPLLAEGRDTFAREAKKYQYPFLLFTLADNKDIAAAIYKMIKPEFSVPFRTDADDSI